MKDVAEFRRDDPFFAIARDGVADEGFGSVIAVAPFKDNSFKSNSAVSFPKSTTEYRSPFGFQWIVTRALRRCSNSRRTSPCSCTAGRRRFTCCPGTTRLMQGALSTVVWRARSLVHGRLGAQGITPFETIAVCPDDLSQSIPTRSMRPNPPRQESQTKPKAPSFVSKTPISNASGFSGIRMTWWHCPSVVPLTKSSGNGTAGCSRDHLNEVWSRANSRPSASQALERTSRSSIGAAGDSIGPINQTQYTENLCHADLFSGEADPGQVFSQNPSSALAAM